LVATLPFSAVGRGYKEEVSEGAKREGHPLNMGPSGGCGIEATPEER